MNLRILIKNILERDSSRALIIDADFNKSYSRSDFYQQVKRAVSYIQSQKSESIILVSENSIEMLAMFVAAILADVRITLLSPRQDWDLKSSETIFFEENSLILVDNLKDVGVQLKSIFIDGLNTEPLMDFASTQKFNVCIPTSATTGQSKLVIQSEDNIISNVNALISHHKLNENSIVGSCLPFFHVNALYFSFFSVFLAGGITVYSKRFDPRAILNSIDKYNIQIYSLIPLYVQKLIQYKESLNIKNIEKLRYIVSAAAPLSVETTKEFVSIFHKQIIQGYGLSEGVNFSCTMPTDLDQNIYENIMYTHGYPSIGISLNDNEIKIINSNGEIVQCGEVGELWIKGKNIFKGYKNTNNNRLFENEFFKTGDLGFYKIINQIPFYFITGRLKEVAKINGESINLRDLDEIYKTYIKSELDFFVTSFLHSRLGEIPVLICKVADSEKSIESFSNTYKLQMHLIPKNLRANFLIFSESEIRTPSGKAKRWNFKEDTLVFKDSVFTSDELLILSKKSNQNRN